RYVSTSALVTNMAVHFTWGREASSVWVTQLDNGNVVTDADVVIADYCSGNEVWRGKTGVDGTILIPKSLGTPTTSSYCNNWSKPLLVVAKKGSDFSFTVSGWTQGITPEQFSMPTGSEYSTPIYHTVLDRALFRAGETVSMKHYMRKHVLQGITVMTGASGEHKIVITHSGSGTEYKLKSTFGADGVGETKWKIPTEAKLGTYQITIDSRVSGQFKVEQFRLPSMRATVSGSSKPLVRPKQVDVDLHVAYLSGGGASGLAAKLRTVVEPSGQSFSDYPDYQFGGKEVKEGIQSNVPNAYDYDFEDDGATAPSKEKAAVIPVTLDGNGSARINVANIPAIDQASQLVAELEYADANGEILTSSGRIKLVPSSLNVGVRTEGWVATADQTRLRILVLDLDGKPHAQQQVDVSLYQSKYYSYRKRLIGGFYTYESTQETRKLPEKCSGKTNEQGLLLCEMKPGVSGQILVRAETHDAQSQIAGATASIWVAGKDDWWFGGTSGDRMDVLPEKKEYEAGDIARFQVRMPFRSATALVTVEREGVITSFVKHLEGNAPIVEVPITAQYSPNVFVSVLAVRGRIAHAERTKSSADMAKEITALVDLNKPAYRLGLAQIKVGWKPHRLNVKVSPAQSTYKVRDKVDVKIHVERADGGVLPAGSEVSLAAVDEALLDLMPNNSWNLLDALM
ncbi:MAG: MG2 domain-containing protein, partial [Steroidobacter sp.]